MRWPARVAFPLLLRSCRRLDVGAVTIYHRTSSILTGRESTQVDVASIACSMWTVLVQVYMVQQKLRHRPLHDVWVDACGQTCCGPAAAERVRLDLGC